MIKGIAYARYSSERQTEQSIEGQLRACKEYADRHDIVLVDTYIDRAKTGTNDNRDNFQRMLKDSYKKVWDVILVYKLDRFSRNKYEMAIHKKTLKDNGIKLISVQENIPDGPEGIILESLLEGMAEYYSAELSQKIKRGLKESRLKGNYTGGGICFGYKVINKKIFINEDQAEIVKFIYEQYANGVVAREIIEKLTEQGILYRKKPFEMNTLFYLLRNERYIGIHRHGEETYRNIYPQIVSNELFGMVQQRIEKNRKGKKNSVNDTLLRGKLKCGYCGKSVIAESDTARSGKLVRYYKCRGRKTGSKCEQEMLRKEILEQAIVDVVYKVFSNTKIIDSIAEKIINLREKNNKLTSILNILNDEKKEIKKSIDNLISAIEKGIITASTQERLEILEARKSEIDKKIIIEQNKQNFYVTKDEIIGFIKKAIKKEPKQMIYLLIKQITLYNDKIEIVFNYTNDKGPDENQGLNFIFGEEKITLAYGGFADYEKERKFKVTMSFDV